MNLYNKSAASDVNEQVGIASSAINNALHILQNLPIVTEEPIADNMHEAHMELAEAMQHIRYAHNYLVSEVTK